MVQVDGGNNANLVALLAVELFGNGFKLLCAGDIHVNHAGVGLASGGNGGSGGSGVRRKAASVVGNGGTGHREIHEVQRLGAIQHGTIAGIILDAGQRLLLIVVCQRSQIIGSGLELGIAHAVADEQEHILGESRIRLGGDAAHGSGQRQRTSHQAAGKFFEVHFLFSSQRWIGCCFGLRLYCTQCV